MGEGAPKCALAEAFVLVDSDCYRTGMTQRAGGPCYHYGGLSRCGRCWFVGVAAAASKSEQ